MLWDVQSFSFGHVKAIIREFDTLAAGRQQDYIELLSATVRDFDR